jgi:hypothetical protein
MTVDDIVKLANSVGICVEGARHSKVWVADLQSFAEVVAEHEYQRGYFTAMNWKKQNHLEHLPTNESNGYQLLSEKALTDMCDNYGWDMSYQSMRAYRMVEAMSLQLNKKE